MDLLQSVVNGVLLGTLYGLFGLGLAFGFGIMRIVNVAQGEFIVLSAYIGLVLGSFIPVPPMLLILPVAAISFGYGYALQGLMLNRVVGKDPMPPLLITFGLSIVLRNLMVEVWSADYRSISIGTLKLQGFGLLGLRIGVLPLVIMGIVLVLFVALHLLMTRTRFGRLARATADDYETVQFFGVDYRRIYCIAMGISAALAAAAGMLIAMRSTFNPFSGVDRLLISFEVVIIGGLGSLWGMVLGGIILGVTQLVSLQYDPNAGLMYAHIVFFIILMVLPSGLASWRHR
jgi:branched-chain amino acid transport system permease protein